MKKIICTLVAVLSLAAFAMAQDVKPATMQIGNDRMDGYSTTVSHGQKSAEAWIATTLKNLGLDYAKIGDSYTAIGQNVMGIANDKIDLYIQATQPEGQTTTITMAATPSEGSKATTDEINTGIQKMLENMENKIRINENGTIKPQRAGNEEMKIETNPKKHHGMRRNNGGKLSKVSSGHKIKASNDSKMKAAPRQADEMETNDASVLDILQ